MREIRILVVDDNPGDVRLTKEALRDGRVVNPLDVVRDGEEALDFLMRRGHHAGATRPGLILLDLHLPIVDGREVLAEIRRDPELSQIPLIVLTGSSPEAAEIDAPNMAKPVSFEDLIRTVGSFDRFDLCILGPE